MTLRIFGVGIPIMSILGMMIFLTGLSFLGFPSFGSRGRSAGQQQGVGDSQHYSASDRAYYEGRGDDPDDF